MSNLEAALEELKNGAIQDAREELNLLINDARGGTDEEALERFNTAFQAVAAGAATGDPQYVESLEAQVRALAEGTRARGNQARVRLIQKAILRVGSFILQATQSTEENEDNTNE